MGIANCKSPTGILITASPFSSLVFVLILILVRVLFFFFSFRLLYWETSCYVLSRVHIDETVLDHVCATGVGIASAIEVDI